MVYNGIIERKRKRRGEKMDKANEAKKAYMKEWRARNKDKIKATQQRYWEKKFEEGEKSC
jgi:hypothetical protein